MVYHTDQQYQYQPLGVVAECSKVLTTVPWPLMVWSILALGTYKLRLVSWVFHVIFSFVHFISLYTLGGLRAFRKPLLYSMYVFNLRIANHILIIIKIQIVPNDISHIKITLFIIAWSLSCCQWCCVCIINIYSNLLNWPSVSMLYLFIFFSMFFVLIHDYTLCFIGSACCKFNYYIYSSIWPYYIVIHLY